MLALQGKCDAAAKGFLSHALSLIPDHISAAYKVYKVAFNNGLPILLLFISQVEYSYFWSVIYGNIFDSFEAFS